MVESSRAGSAGGGSSSAGEPHIQVTNEFTTARVRKVLTRNGERLEISSPRTGTSVMLDPLELESLTWQTTETFSRLLEHPFGHEEEQVQGRPLSQLISDRSETRFEQHGDPES